MSGDIAQKTNSILIIDDSSDLAKFLGAALAAQGEIISAGSGAEGIGLALSEKPDLILLDVMMPGMDGFEVCAKLKKETGTRNIPVIFITANDREESEIKGFELGAVDFITKPISAPVVRARVKTHLELKKIRDSLEKLTTRDALTGIFNRRHFNEYIAQEFRRARRGHGRLSLVMADIDCFKEFNDNYGHSGGDACLRRVARALGEGINRPADLAFRFGGEEFACILPDTSVKGAVIVAENLLNQVESMNYPHAFSHVADHVTLSVGVGTLEPSDGNSPLDLIELADRFLYEAKKGGRNQIRWMRSKDGIHCVD